MPTILRNDVAEALLLDIRACRHAGAQAVKGRAGAFLIFPTSVVIPSRAGHAVFPLRSDVEPGTLVTAAGSARVEGLVAGVSVTGAFHWALGDGAAPPAGYQFVRRGRDVAAPPWATQLPSSQHLTLLTPTSLALRQNRLRRQGGNAEHWLLALTEQVIRRSCRGSMRRAIRYRPPVDVDDVVQRGLQAASRLLPLYTSSGRPPCSWLGMLRLDCHRDMNREISRLDWLPSDAMIALTLEDFEDVRGFADPALIHDALVNSARRLGRASPRITPDQLGTALRALTLLEFEQAAAATIPGPESPERHDGAADDEPVVSATVARLVSDDAELIGSAADGDLRALRRVGDQVVRQLSQRAEAPAATRHRCWEEFRQSGHLFASPVGLERFRAVADAEALAAIDERLRRAAGWYPTVKL